MIDKEELLEALKEHLSISIDTEYSFEEGPYLEVTLLWDGTKITSSGVALSSLVS